MSLYDVLRHVRPLHQYSAKAVAGALEGEQVTVAGRAVLERLREAGPQTVPQLARSQWLPRQAVQRVVDDALRAGLVQRRPNPAHRRSALIALTPAGSAAFERIHDVELANLGPLADALEPADVEAAVRVVAALTQHARRLAADGAPGPRTPEEEIR